MKAPRSRLWARRSSGREGISKRILKSTSGRVEGSYSHCKEEDTQEPAEVLKAFLNLQMQGGEAGGLGRGRAAKGQVSKGPRFWLWRLGFTLKATGARCRVSAGGGDLILCVFGSPPHPPTAAGDRSRERGDWRQRDPKSRERVRRPKQDSGSGAEVREAGVRGWH